MASRRNYIDNTYLTAYLSGTPISGEYSSVDDLISAAEAMIDGYVGTQRKWFRTSNTSAGGVYTPPEVSGPLAQNFEIRGRVDTVVDATHFTLPVYLHNTYQNGFFTLCNIDIIAGTGAGQSNHVAASTYAGQITVSAAWETAPDTTSIFRIYQLGKFPREQDVFFNSLDTPLTYYKAIPEEVRIATAAQAAYINSMGRDYFNSDDGQKQSEHIGSYGYTRQSGSSETTQLIAPEARAALKGYVRRSGSIRV